MNAPQPQPQAPAQALERRVYLHAITLLSIWNRPAHHELKTRFMARFQVPSLAHYNALLHANVQQQYFPQWVNPAVYPPPPDIHVATIQGKIDRVHSDVNELQTEFRNSSLGILVRFPPNDPFLEDVDGHAEKELHVPFPPFENSEFRIRMSNLLNSVVYAKYSYIVHIYQ